MQGRPQFEGYVSSALGDRLSISLFRAALLALFAALPLAPSAAADAPVPTLVVTATGEVSATPDLAVVDAGVVSRGRTTAEALQKADAAAARLVADAKAAGLADADVATSSFSVSPLWSSTGSDGTPSRITGYSVENTFELKIRRLADLGPLLERLVAGGTNSVSGIAFDVSDAEKRRDQARVAAVNAARARAELLAEAAGERLVRVLAITESSDDRPMPRVFAKAVTQSAAVPVEPGSRTISAAVTMTFELAPRETK